MRSLALTTFLAVLVQGGVALRCSRCESNVKGGECFQGKGIALEDCAGKEYAGIFPELELPAGIYNLPGNQSRSEQHWCMALSDAKYIYRNCVRGSLDVVQGYCDYLHSNPMFTCIVCREDGCNGSPSQFSGSLAAFALLLPILNGWL